MVKIVCACYWITRVSSSKPALNSIGVREPSRSSMSFTPLSTVTISGIWTSIRFNSRARSFLDDPLYVVQRLLGVLAIEQRAAVAREDLRDFFAGADAGAGEIGFLIQCIGHGFASRSIGFDRGVPAGSQSGRCVHLRARVYRQRFGAVSRPSSRGIRDRPLPPRRSTPETERASGRPETSR